MNANCTSEPRSTAFFCKVPIRKGVLVATSIFLVWVIEKQEARPALVEGFIDDFVQGARRTVLSLVKFSSLLSSKKDGVSVGQTPILIHIESLTCLVHHDNRRLVASPGQYRLRINPLLQRRRRGRVFLSEAWL